MAISDDELVRQLESVPLVDPPDMRAAVLARVRAGFNRPADRLKPVRTHYRIAFALAAALAIVVGIAVWRSPALRPQSAAATMAAPQPELIVQRIGDRFSVQANVGGRIDFDRTKLSRVETLSDGTVILQAKPGAAGTAAITLQVPGKEVVKTSVAVN